MFCASQCSQAVKKLKRGFFVEKMARQFLGAICIRARCCALDPALLFPRVRRPSGLDRNLDAAEERERTEGDKSKLVVDARRAAKSKR